MACPPPLPRQFPPVPNTQQFEARCRKFHIFRRLRRFQVLGASPTNTQHSLRTPNRPEDLLGTCCAAAQHAQTPQVLVKTPVTPRQAPSVGCWVGGAAESRAAPAASRTATWRA